MIQSKNIDGITKTLMLGSVGLVGISSFAGFCLSSPVASATSTTASANATVRISSACTLNGIVNTAHEISLSNGNYSGASGFGQTTLKAFCNDAGGFAIYAIGYTNEEYGNNTLHWNKAASASDNTNAINTGVYTSGTTVDSTWSMKLNALSGTYAATIDDGVSAHNNSTENFTNWHVVPDRYKRVAYRLSGTDVENNGSGTGSSITTTYDAYVAPTQPAGTYVGQVKYTLVHPSSHVAPTAFPVVLDTGKTINAKMKTLAANSHKGYSATDSYIKSINVHLNTPAPAGFVPTDDNTISSSTSSSPVYIVFDNTNDAGIMHFYTEGDQIVLPSDSSYTFSNLRNLSAIFGISDWDASNTTDMNHMFNQAGSSATTFAIDLSPWNTSNVTDMGQMFYSSGYSATTWSIGDLSSWDTSSVTNMNQMFLNIATSATTWTIGDISSWDTSSVTDMSGMFTGAGRQSSHPFNLDLSSWDTSSVTAMAEMFSSAGSSATTFTLDLSTWDTSNVTNMNSMFAGAGYSSTTFSLDISFWNTSNLFAFNKLFFNAGVSADSWTVIIPRTNGNNINNSAGAFYGGTSILYAEPPSGRLFTLAQQ